MRKLPDVKITYTFKEKLRNVKVLANSISLAFNYRWGELSRESVHIRCEVDQYGYMDIVTPRDFAEARKAIDILIDELEVAEWRRIGPEDSEVFLKEEYMEVLGIRKALAELHDGWYMIDESS